jgi:hypothetical protein
VSPRANAVSPTPPAPGPLRHRLPPFLGEPLGGRAAAVDFVVVPALLDQPVCPGRDGADADLNPTRTARKTATHNDHAEDDTVAEIANLLGLEVEILKRALIASMSCCVRTVGSGVVDSSGIAYSCRPRSAEAWSRLK